MIGIGINYPLTKGSNGYFEQTYDTFANEKSRLIMLLNTFEGERLMQPNFGLNLQKYLFDNYSGTNFKDAIISEITKKVNFWIPNLNIDDITIDDSNINSNQLTVTVSFSLMSDETQSDTITFKI
jgi:phage baseplate assembly protein W